LSRRRALGGAEPSLQELGQVEEHDLLHLWSKLGKQSRKERFTASCQRAYLDPYEGSRIARSRKALHEMWCRLRGVKPRDPTDDDEQRCKKSQEKQWSLYIDADRTARNFSRETPANVGWTENAHSKFCKEYLAVNNEFDILRDKKICVVARGFPRIIQKMQKLAARSKPRGKRRS
jgi:hypothetical protein